MTVIAYKNGIMACDSLWSDDNIRSAYKTKLTQISNDCIVGGAGDVDDRALVKLLTEWRRSITGTIFDITPNNLPLASVIKEVCDQDVVLLMAIKTSKNDIHLFVITGGANACVHEVTMPFYAIGSGAHMAIGAMAQGASAEKAVKIACKYEMNCALPVHKLEI